MSGRVPRGISLDNFRVIDARKFCLREYFGTSTARDESTWANSPLSSARGNRAYASLIRSGRPRGVHTITCTGHVSASLWLTTCGGREIFVANRTLVASRTPVPVVHPPALAHRQRARVSNSKENIARTVPTRRHRRAASRIRRE